MVTTMERKEKLVVGAATALVVYTLSLSFLGPIVLAPLRNRTFSNSGSVTAIGVGVYFDQACTNEVTSINWGVVEPDSSVNRTVYIRNEGNVPATLEMTTSNWDPANAADYITLAWDYGGQTLNVNEVIEVKFTLTVSQSISGITDFSFAITISANG